jgi:hypothetical protein
MLPRTHSPTTSSVLATQQHQDCKQAAAGAAPASGAALCWACRQDALPLHHPGPPPTPQLWDGCMQGGHICQHSPLSTVVAATMAGTTAAPAAAPRCLQVETALILLPHCPRQVHTSPPRPSLEPASQHCKPLLLLVTAQEQLCAAAQLARLPGALPAAPVGRAKGVTAKPAARPTKHCSAESFTGHAPLQEAARQPCSRPNLVR